MGAYVDLTGRRLLPLPGLGAGRRAHALSLAILLCVLLSRLLLFPDGPWEQDEALFATGVLDFNPVRHRPHPPGFPGWIVIGKVFAFVTSDALRGLRVASSLASVGLLIALASLLARVTRPPIALAAALAFSFSPVAWAHAPRAFSSTPALCLAAFALVCWADPARSGIRVLGWALLGAAATVRPQLVPTLTVVAIAGLWMHRDRRAPLGAGLLAAVAVVTAAYAYAAYASGGVTAYWTVTHAHLNEHAVNATRTIPWRELGLVRGLGSPAVALALAAASVVGAALATHRNRALGLWLVALLGVTMWIVLAKHHPAFPRYAVAVVLVATPPIAIACDRLPPTVGLAVLLGCTIFGGAAAGPTLVAMHTHPLPPVAALRTVARWDAAALAFSHGNFSFARLAHLDGTLSAPIIDVHSVDQSAPFPRGTTALAGSSLRFLPGVTVCTKTFDDFPAQARALSQHRFERTTVATPPVLLGAGVRRPEHGPSGVPFAWLSGAARVWAPAGTTTLALSLWVPRSEDHLALRATAGEETTAVELPTGATIVRVPLPACAEGCPIDLAFPAVDPPADGGPALSAQLLSAWPEGPGFFPSAHVWSPGTPPAVQAAGVTLTGVWGPETFWDDQPGAWTRGRARADFPAAEGTLEVKLARPQHTAGDVTLHTDAETRTVAVGAEQMTVTLAAGAVAGQGHLTIEAPVFVPSEVNAQSDDDRELGIILFEVRFTPKHGPCAGK